MASLAASIARKIGEGYDRPGGHSDLPIDINYGRVAEWLVDRKQVPVDWARKLGRHCYMTERYCIAQVDRKQVPADWARKLQALQAKSGEALKELPPGFLGQFEGGDEMPLDYLRAKQVLDKLVASEGAERSFLGSFKGAAGTWDKIVRAYEYNLLHVGEAALTLGRNTDYEIPFLKKQAARLQQQMGDLERRQAEALKSASAAAADYEQECRELGIEGKDIRGGLLALTAELPSLMGAALAALRSADVDQAVEHYAAFAAHASSAASSVAAAVNGTGGSSASSGEEGGGGEASTAEATELLPTLREVVEGRTAPPSQQEPGSSADVAVEPGEGYLGGGTRLDAPGEAAAQQPPAGISWDLDDLSVSAAAGGDLDAGSGAGAVGSAAGAGGGGDSSAGGGISWDLGDLAAALEAAGGAADGTTEDQSAAGAAAAAGTGAGGGGGEGVAGPAVDISWDIDMTTAGEEAGELSVVEQQREGQERGQGGGGAAAAGGTGTAGDGGGRLAAFADAPPELRRLLEDGAYRAKLLDDLFELRAFLAQRALELSGKASGSDLLGSTLPEDVRHVGAEGVAAMRDAVDAAITALTGERLQQLLLLRSSPRHLDRLVASLAHKGGQEAKFKRWVRLLVHKGGQEAKFKKAAREAEARRGDALLKALYNEAAREAEARRGEAQRQLMAGAARLAALVKHTRAAKELVEEALGAMWLLAPRYHPGIPASDTLHATLVQAKELVEEALGAMWLLAPRYHPGIPAPDTLHATLVQAKELAEELVEEALGAMWLLAPRYHPGIPASDTLHATLVQAKELVEEALGAKLGRRINIMGEINNLI
ncbi:hypothetical protein N2152v2_010336 [Parachlorella kessleri]